MLKVLCDYKFILTAPAAKVVHAQKEKAPLAGVFASGAGVLLSSRKL